MVPVGLPVHVRACCADPGWDLTQASQVLVGIFGMGIAGPRAWHPPVPSVGGSAGPCPSHRGICFAGSLSPRPLLLLWHHQFPLLKILVDLVLHGLEALILGAGGAAASQCPSPGKGLGVHCPGPGEGGQGVGFLSPLSARAGGAALSQPWRQWPRAGWCPCVPVAPTRVAVTLPAPLFPLKHFPRG